MRHRYVNAIMSSLDCLIGPFTGLGLQTILVRLLGATLTLLAVWYIGSRKRPPPTKSMAPASQAMASRETDPLFAPFLRMRRGRYGVKGSGQSYPAEYNPFTTHDAKPGRGSPSTGGQQAAPRRPPTPPNPFDEETSSDGKNPFSKDTFSSAGNNPFDEEACLKESIGKRYSRR